MKMKIFRLMVVSLAVLSLSACANTFQGVGEDLSNVGTGISDTTKELQDWSHGKDSELTEKIGAVPTGYAQPHYYKSRRLTAPVIPPQAAAVNTATTQAPVMPEAVDAAPLPSPKVQHSWDTPATPIRPAAPQPAPGTVSHLRSTWDEGAPTRLAPLPLSDTPASIATPAPVETGSGVTVNYDVLDNPSFQPSAPAVPATPPPVNYAPGVTVYPVDPGEWQQPAGVPVSEGSYAIPDTMVVSAEGIQSFGYTPVSYPRAGGDVPLETIFFNHGSSRLGAGDKTKLATVAQEVKNTEVYMVQVVGHSSKRVAPGLDPVRQSAINLQMSMQRAQAVATHLYKEGLTPELVEATGRGDTQPNSQLPAGMAQEAADRRVEVFVSH